MGMRLSRMDSSAQSAYPGSEGADNTLVVRMCSAYVHHCITVLLSVAHRSTSVSVILFVVCRRWMARTVKAGTWGSSWTSTATLAVGLMGQRGWIRTDLHLEQGHRGPAETVQVTKADR